MKMKTKNILLTIIMISIFLVISSTPSYALSDLVSGGKSFISLGESQTEDTMTQDSIVEMSNKILGVLIPIGTVAAVLVAAYLGIKFMTGSIEDQAKVKETLIPYVIGCIVVFGGFTIWKLVVEVLGNSLT